jgi:hypothetical protein
LQWSVENSADDIKKSGADVHTNNPAEELNYHGLMNDTKSAQRGVNFGYPACFSIWDASTLGSGLKVGEQTVIDASVGSPTAADCAKRQAPRLVFPAHTAPLDIKFKKDGSAAYVTFHGSWYVLHFFFPFSPIVIPSSPSFPLSVLNITIY